MPELPEVETVCRGLQAGLEGQTIRSVKLNRPDLRFAFPANFVDLLQNARIHSIGRRAKYILIALDTEKTLLIHLGMSGRVLINPQTSSIHDHVVLTTDEVTVVYRDPRRFGYMDIVPFNQLTTHKFLNKLGVEPLSEDFTGDYLKKRLSHRKGAIKNLLLQQELIAGLGNIYVCEALHISRIHPATLGRDLSLAKLDHLVQTIKIVLEKAIQAGGSSLKDHRQTNGSLGYFQHHFKVYGREGQPCGTCQSKAFIRRSVQAGRATFFCPKCQR